MIEKTTTEKLKKYGIDSHKQLDSVATTLFRLIHSTKEKSEVEEMITANDSTFEFVKYCIKNSYLNGVCDGMLLEIHEGRERYK